MFSRGPCHPVFQGVAVWPSLLYPQPSSLVAVIQMLDQKAGIPSILASSPSFIQLIPSLSITPSKATPHLPTSSRPLPSHNHTHPLPELLQPSLTGFPSSHTGLPSPTLHTGARESFTDANCIRSPSTELKYVSGFSPNNFPTPACCLQGLAWSGLADTHGIQLSLPSSPSALSSSPHSRLPHVPPTSGHSQCSSLRHRCCPHTLTLMGPLSSQTAAHLSARAPVVFRDRDHGQV